MANYTKKAIMENFEAMLRVMPFDKITVTALVEKSEISSNTFYYHYRDIFDLLDEWIKAKFSKYPSEGYLNADWMDTIKQILHEMQDNKELVKHIYGSISRERLEQYLFNTIEEDVFHVIQIRTKDRHIPEETQRLLTGMCCYTMVGFFIKYLWTGMNRDLDDYADRLGELLEKCIRLYIDTV